MTEFSRRLKISRALNLSLLKYLACALYSKRWLFPKVQTSVQRTAQLGSARLHLSAMEFTVQKANIASLAILKPFRINNS